MKNYLIPIIFAALISTVSLTSMQAFAGNPCDLTSQSNGAWDSAFNQIPTSSDVVCISQNDVQLDGVGLAKILQITDAGGSLFIGCDGDLTTDIIDISRGSLINHGSVNANTLFNGGLVQNSSSAFTIGSFNNFETFENISTICNQPIGGTVGSMDTVSLLVAGAQANIGWGIIALVGAVVGVGIVYKAKTNKTHKETL